MHILHCMLLHKPEVRLSLAGGPCDKIMGTVLQVCVVETARWGCYNNSKCYPDHALHSAFQKHLYPQVPAYPYVRPPGHGFLICTHMAFVTRGVNTAGYLHPVEVESQVVPEILRGPAPLPSLWTAADALLGHPVS